MFEVSHGHFFEIFYNLDVLTGWGLYGNDVEWKSLNADQVETFCKSLAIFNAKSNVPGVGSVSDNQLLERASDGSELLVTPALSSSSDLTHKLAPHRNAFLMFYLKMFLLSAEFNVSLAESLKGMHVVCL